MMARKLDYQLKIDSGRITYRAVRKVTYRAVKHLLCKTVERYSIRDGIKPIDSFFDLTNVKKYYPGIKEAK